MSESLWTLDELAERVDAALAVDYQGQPSGRVRDVPDRRAIRWYTTIGLVDRPAGHRGRTAVYGPRHLLQLVAVKRLQARGLPLVAIQQELAGATDAQLARVARLPVPALPPRRPPIGAAPAGDSAAATGMARRAGFWRERPAATSAAADAAAAEATASSEVAGGEADGVATMRGVRLGERATLLLDPGRPLDRADLRAILEAARPLLDALRARGLDGRPGSPGRTGDTDPGREHP
jgi:DNA-binding transcriptional MerR regulator